MENNIRTDFLLGMLGKKRDEHWESVTRERLVYILKGLEGVGIITKGKSMETVMNQMHELIKQETNFFPHHLTKLLILYSSYYARLHRESKQMKINELNFQIENIDREMKINELNSQIEIIDGEWGSLCLDYEKAWTKTVRDGIITQFPNDVKTFDLLTEKLINNPQKMQYIIDSTGEGAQYFPEIGLTIKNLDMSSFLEDPKFVKEFIMKCDVIDLLDSFRGNSAGEKVIIYTSKHVFGYKDYNGNNVPIHPKMKALLDVQGDAGYEINAERMRNFRNYLADIMGVKYDPNKISENNIVYRAEMFVRAKLGWYFENIGFEGVGVPGIPGDRYFNINGKHFDSFQCVRLDKYFQEINTRNRDSFSASITLVACDDNPSG